MSSLRPFRLRPEDYLQPMVEVTATSEGRNRLRQLRMKRMPITFQMMPTKRHRSSECREVQLHPLTSVGVQPESFMQGAHGELSIV